MKGSGGRTTWGISVCACAILFLSCTTTGPELPELTGSWSGANNQVAVTLALREGRFGDVTGTGTLTSGSTAFSVAVEGQHRHPAVSLGLRLSEQDEIRLDGTLVEGVVVTGSLDGLGFDRVAITLSRLVLVTGEDEVATGAEDEAPTGGSGQ